MTTPIPPIVLVTDFGDGIYVGQIRARLGDHLPEVPVIDLVHDLPPFRADLAAYLLPALIRDMPGGAIYVCVVDPGVGGTRCGLLARARDCWVIGPDNGLLAPLVHCTEGASVQRIGWCPAVLSASFHGRDWFAPAAARLFAGEDLQLTPIDPSEMVGSDWPSERAAVVYVDRFGNLMTGLRAVNHGSTQSLHVGTRTLPHARTFCDVMPGEAFWYENAFGLVEIAVNQGRADRLLALSPGDSVGPFTPPN
jgi:S-adenosylmethionine hydrolase